MGVEWDHGGGGVLLPCRFIMEFTMAVLKFYPPAAILSESFKEQPPSIAVASKQ